MLLPIRTTVDDIHAVCVYLVTKPTGATLKEAKAVVDKKVLDGRKLVALKFWGLIEDDGSKLKITDQGRQYVKDGGSSRSEVLSEVVRRVEPYKAIVERAALREEGPIGATDVAAHWHEHFRNEVSDSDKILNDQAVCFFQIAQGADLGTLTIGRKGMPTRFDFDADATRAFVDGPGMKSQGGPAATVADTPEKIKPDTEKGESTGTVVSADTEKGESTGTAVSGNRVFITHGKNLKILNQVKELVAYGKFEPVVAMENETAAKPVPEKVMDDMRTCKAAVIHVSAESVLYDKEGNEVPRINDNVLIEIGAAMALYGEKFVLLVEEGLGLPSNLQGLYECRYEGDELNMPATMKLLKAFSEF